MPTDTSAPTFQLLYAYIKAFHVFRYILAGLRFVSEALAEIAREMTAADLYTAQNLETAFHMGGIIL